MKHLKFLAIIIFSFFTTLLFSSSFSDMFNKKITQDELQRLEQGEIIIRNIGTVRKLSLTESNNDLIKKVQKELNDRNPNYLAEIIKVVPKKGNETLIQQIYDGINDIESYTEIPYFSERQQKWYDLYDSVVINSTSGTENNKINEYSVEMTPFGIIDISAELEKTDNSLYFSMINKSKVIYEYKNITCIKPKKMYSSIVLFEYNDYYVLYGIGALNAPVIFFLQDRIETAFIGRMKYFCKYMFEQINIQ